MLRASFTLAGKVTCFEYAREAAGSSDPRPTRPHPHLNSCRDWARALGEARGADLIHGRTRRRRREIGEQRLDPQFIDEKLARERAQDVGPGIQADEFLGLVFV